MSLEERELSELKSKIGRDPTSTELQIVAAEWSEHCSYKSSKRHLKMLPMDGRLVSNEKGYDSWVLDVGDGYVVTAHIESHNHPSAVEPYGGAADTIKRVCINRHSGDVNYVFFDLSVRDVGLKELWKLKWHRNYDVNGPYTLAGGVQPDDWPKWMKRFKSY